jgi:hypothetical protein
LQNRSLETALSAGFAGVQQTCHNINWKVKWNDIEWLDVVTLVGNLPQSGWMHHLPLLVENTK